MTALHTLSVEKKKVANVRLLTIVLTALHTLSVLNALYDLQSQCLLDDLVCAEFEGGRSAYQ